ncbi:uncharacterized protein DUF1624 [Saccharopolyspora erythraea NRRL 2338]|uniref:Membrane protein n=2 Tax=Saccharopolyspora erythraea TaxID=1836 RepID=A4FEM9_SACEN|nr:heparan-alpha-glucosaminide N-acetyltransferase domain-containing protein [Saccharopolyspora erythraea]EQD81597.1 hypothetical protein N599_35300 [Saccharopolyspora erythraea D]PFG96229.1 uncharacterized protein DUF1624 [Saccharopolyspora erythraea NRRL 2338]QRK92756.1 DUF1624 domain-containing protein [Saccharopolyspora erythraea]CAM02504.1 putative membrane protein [Saccharopolyspora erythraea NRRL 2338]
MNLDETTISGRSHPAQPKARRLRGVDATRGIALVGMMGVHALYTGDLDEGPALWYSVAGGRAAATFAVLAGLGIAFSTGRERIRPGAQGWSIAASLTVRALAIAFIGLALGYSDPDIADVILTYYGVLFLLAIPLVFLSTRALAVTGVAVALLMPVVSMPLRVLLPAPRLENPTFAWLFSDPLGLLAEILLTGVYPVLPWTTYLCAGLLLGRLRLSTVRTAWRLLVGGTALAAGAWLVSWSLLRPLGGLEKITEAGEAAGMPSGAVDYIVAFGPTGNPPTSSWWWLALCSQHSATPSDLLHTTGVAVGLLGLMLLLAHVSNPNYRLALDAFIEPLAAAGSMTLTLYSAHVVFMNSPLDVFDEELSLAIQVLVAVFFALLWQHHVGRGPLESGVTWLSKKARTAVEHRA